MGKKSTVVRVGKDIVDAAKAAGFATVDAYIRHLRERAPTEAAQQPSAAPVQPAQPPGASAQDKIMGVAARTLERQVEKAEKTDRTPPPPVVKVQLPPGAVPPQKTWEDMISDIETVRERVPAALGLQTEIDDLRAELDKRDAQIERLKRALEDRKIWYSFLPLLLEARGQLYDLKDLYVLRSAKDIGLTEEEMRVVRARIIARAQQPWGMPWGVMPQSWGYGATSTGAAPAVPDDTVAMFEQIVGGWLTPLTREQAQEWLDGKMSIVQILQRPDVQGLLFAHKDFAISTLPKLSPDRIIQIISQHNPQLAALLNTERGRRRIEEELEAARRFIEGL